MIKNILVTGANGQLGKCLLDEINRVSYRYNFIFATRADLDCTNFDQLNEFVIDNKIDLIINCAAYTNVDKAEQVPYQELCINEIRELFYVFKINKNLRLIHISTDYAIDPVNRYGKSKQKAERLLLNSTKLYDRFKIIRIAGLFSKFGNNFIKTILDKLSNDQKVEVTGEIQTYLTYGPDLAEFIINLISCFDYPSINVNLYEFSNPGITSWYQIAKFIGTIVGKENLVVRNDNYKSLADRPTKTNFTRLDNTIYSYNKDLPGWQNRVYQLVKELTYGTN